MPDQITQLLDQIDRLDADAEAGPWDLEPAVETQNGWSLGTVRSNATGESIAADIYNSDGALIALSRTALPALSKAVRVVLELHKPFHADHYYNGMDGESLHKFVPRCEGCDNAGGIEDYPCPTVQAITDAMNEGESES